MGGLKTELLKRLREYSPVDRIVLLYERGEDFVKELSNYMTGGVVISNPSFFMMVKAIDSAKPIRGQWAVQNPDCWYIRWVAGEDALGDMFNSIEPLPFIMFRRLNEQGETGLKKYAWDRMARLTKGAK